MQTVSIPWRAYYDQENLDLAFPDAWDIEVSNMKGGADIGDAGIREAFANPIGSSTLREIAQGKRSAAIIVDDLSRPTPAHRLLPYIFEELEAAGIGVNQIKIIGFHFMTFEVCLSGYACAVHQELNVTVGIYYLFDRLIDRHFVADVGLNGEGFPI